MRNMNEVLATGAAGAAIVLGAGGPPAMGADCNGVEGTAVHTAEEALQASTSFNSLVLDPHNPNASLEVVNSSRPGYEMIDPLVIRCDGRILGYIGRTGVDSVAEIPANHTRITEWIEHKAIGGHNGISIKHPQKAGFVVSQTLRPSPDNGNVVAYFAGSQGGGYGGMP